VGVARASPERTMTVVIEPGPETIGIARGTTAMSSRLIASSISSGVCRPVEAFDKAVALWAAYTRGLVLDPFQLREELVGVAVGGDRTTPGRCR
jgi:hypothetical protein